MTTRVFACRSHLSRPGVSPSRATAVRPASRARSLKWAVIAAMLLVPLAGAAEAPTGWGIALLAGVVIVIVVSMVGSEAGWGWLSLLAATAAIVAPRGQLAPIGPVLFVATGMFLVLWVVNRDSGLSNPEQAGRGSREREAQLAMGLSGERHVGDVLARELPQDYVVINGLKLPRGAGDIDHLVVGPTGVFLVETKTMSGRIVCEPDGTWTRIKTGRGGTAYPAYIGDPAAQVQRNILAVRNCLRVRVPRLFRRTPLWVEGLVVFPHPRTELVADHSRVPAMRIEQAAAYICLHVPQRPLQPDEIEVTVQALLVEGNERVDESAATVQSAQALVELALALPVALVLLFGTVAVSRVVQAQTAVIAVAHEVARAGALGSGPDDAIERMRQRADLVAAGLGLDPRAVQLSWDVSDFRRDPSRVLARVRYTVDVADLPVTAWVPSMTVQAEHVEWVDPFRSGMAAAGQQSP